MKIGVIGANGQLGSDIVNVLGQEDGYDLFSLNHDVIEISDIDSVSDVLKETKPNVLINTAAFHNVEKCEEEYETAYQVNAIGAKNLAEVSQDLGIYLMHISTDYVFSGSKEKPYLEEDLPGPLNVYGNTKLSGEYFIGAISDNYLILRTSGLYGANPCRAKDGRNFADLMISLAKDRDEVRVVDNEVLTPTSTLELARQINELVENRLFGVCHATAEGECSWYEFAKEIFEICELSTPLNIADPSEFPSDVDRPTYSVLENAFLKKNDTNTFKHWKIGLKNYLKQNYTTP